MARVQLHNHTDFDQGGPIGAQGGVTVIQQTLENTAVPGGCTCPPPVPFVPPPVIGNYWALPVGTYGPGSVDDLGQATPGLFILPAGTAPEAVIWHLKGKLSAPISGSGSGDITLAQIGVHNLLEIAYSASTDPYIQSAEMAPFGTDIHPGAAFDFDLSSVLSSGTLADLNALGISGDAPHWIINEFNVSLGITVIEPLILSWSIAGGGGGTSTPIPEPGQWIPEQDLSSQITGSTAAFTFPYAFAPSGLRVLKDRIDITDDVTEDDPSAGTFHLSWTPTDGQLSAYGLGA